MLSGTSSNVEAGQTVTIIFAGKTYTTTVDANGDWTWTVPAADLSGLKDGDASVQVSVTNVNGNVASSAQAFSVDTVAPTVTKSYNSPAALQSLSYDLIDVYHYDKKDDPNSTTVPPTSQMM